MIDSYGTNPTHQKFKVWTFKSERHKFLTNIWYLRFQTLNNSFNILVEVILNLK